MGTFPNLIVTPVGTFAYDYEQALKETEKQRAVLTPEAKAEIMALLEQKSTLNTQLEHKTNVLLSTILMVARVERQISELTTAEMEEYAIALLLLKLKPDEL